MKIRIKNYFTQVSYENIDLIPIWKIPLINNFLLEGLFDFFRLYFKTFQSKIRFKSQRTVSEEFQSTKKIKISSRRMLERSWLFASLRMIQHFNIDRGKDLKEAMAQWLEQSLAEQDDPGSFPAAPFPYVFLSYIVVGKNWGACVF